MHSIALGMTSVVLIIAALTTSRSIAFGDEPKASPPATQPSPSPDLSPKDVVKAIVDALGKNDAQDSGIRTTWNFASPGNKKTTGPLERFIPMVKNPGYAPLLNHKTADVREVAVKDDQAAELVMITDDKGEKSYFVFQLSKQSDGDCKDCWMTDGVIRVEPPPKPVQKLPDGELPA